MVRPGKGCRGWLRQELPGPGCGGLPCRARLGRARRPSHTSSCSELFVTVGGLRFSARSHGDDYVITLFVVQVFHAKLHMVLLDVELSLFPNRQQGGMFVVLWTNAVDDAVGLQEIFLAEQGMHFLVGGVGPDDFSGYTLGALLIGAAFDGIHLKQRG